MDSSRRNPLAATAILLIAGVAAADPIITSVSGTEFARSRRIAIEGTGFGANATGGTVLVGGFAALTSTWTDTRIVAYVPETAPLGTVPLSVSVQEEHQRPSGRFVGLVAPG